MRPALLFLLFLLADRPAWAEPDATPAGAPPPAVSPQVPAVVPVMPAPAPAGGAAPSTAVAPAEVSVAAPQCPLPERPPAKPEFVWELDPYYTEVSLHIPLTDEPIPELSGKNEADIYRKLFVDSLLPRFMLVEAAVFPMPLLGVTLKEYTPDFYKGFNVGTSNLNLLEAITAGFQEPYAISLFLGDMASFVKPGEERLCTNKGYMGYLLSYSNQHIKRNVLIPDNNFEIEWKMKGERVFKDDKLSWSFRVGAKVHDHPDITNSLYLGFRRSNLDFKADFLSFLNNSSIDFRWDFSAKNGHPLRQEYVVGKKYPIKKWHVAFKMDVGLIWEDEARYTGKLHEKDFQSISAVLRPNIEW